MTLPYQELYYASTQQSILTGADGFGFRTYSEGLPKTVIERLRSKNIFVYQAGAKALASIAELLHNPNLVLDYPKTYTFFKLETDDQVFYCFSRTVFIGRDYGWYLNQQEESARSGNLFCHVVIWRSDDFHRTKPDRIFQALLTQFKPRNYSNFPSNSELSLLLTNNQGSPVLLPTVQCTMCDQPVEVPIISRLEQSILAVINAVETNRRVVIVQSESQTEQHLLALLACLPRFIIKYMSFSTNFHDFNLYTDNHILFVNELYQREIPIDHPFLLICNYRTNYFTEYPATDFSTFVSDLICNNKMADLQDMIEDFDHMIDVFTENLSFNQLFYAWLQLYTDDETYAHKFQPVEVMRGIKDYALTTGFREKIEEFALLSFEQAIEAEQHTKIASSLQLFADLNPALGRWQKAQKRFTSYFFCDDNAAKLFNTGISEELAFRALSTEGQEQGISTFISISSLPINLFQFFIRKFIETDALPFNSVEGALYLAVLDKPELKSFGKYLSQSWGNIRYWKFLTEHDFFIGMGESEQFDFFGADTGQYLIEMAKRGEDVLSLIKSKSEKAPFFQIYVDELIRYTSESDCPYRLKIDILEYYTDLLRKGYRNYKNTSKLDQLLKTLLDSYSNMIPIDDSNKLIDVAEKFGKLTQLNIGNESYEWSDMEFYKDTALLITKVLTFKNNVDDFILILPVPSKDDWGGSMLRFMLSALSLDKWNNSSSVLKLILYFINLIPSKGNANNYEGERYNLLSHIPAFYTQQTFSMAQVTERNYLELISFYKIYTDTLWSLRQQKVKNEYEQIYRNFSIHHIIRVISTYLNYLKEFDKSACRIVVEYINNEMQERDNKLINYINENVHTGNIISGLFKKITSPFKKDGQ